LGKRASGTYTVTLQDGIGRQSSVAFSVIRDTTPPTLTLEAVVQSDVLVTWSATDPSPGSGLDTSKCLLKVREDDEGTWQAFSTDCGGDDTYDGQPGHTYTFRLSASDNVSNAASIEVEAVVPYVTKYYYANGQRIAMQKEGVVYYVHSDHLGSTSLTTCGSQDGCDGTPYQGVVARQLYHPYGSPRWSQGTLPTDYTFTGQRNEAGLGLMHYGARFYSPRLGRFVSADSIVPDYEDPQALNRYAYVLNNPCRYTDPSGHCIPFCAPLLTYAAFRYLPRESLAFGTRQLAQTDIPVVSDLAAWDARNTDLIWQAINRTDLQGNPLTTQEQLNLGFEGYTGLVGEAFTVYTAYEGVGAVWRLGKAAYEGVTSKPSSPSEAATEAVEPYEVGRVDDLLNRSVPGDGLDIHHFPQKHPAGQVIPGYDPDIGPGMAVPESMHRKMPRQMGNYTGTARDLGARGLQNLRKYTDAPNSALQKLLSMVRELYPGALDK
jgi:RHS repeat-associated protein